jgi:hypothetical protein
MKQWPKKTNKLLFKGGDPQQPVVTQECYQFTTDGLIDALRISQLSSLSPDPVTVGVASLSFFEAVTAFLHAQLQHQPIINVLKGRGTN